jgi:hypothetical protein
MKQRFTEAHIVGFFQEADAGPDGEGSVPQANVLRRAAACGGANSAAWVCRMGRVREPVVTFTPLRANVQVRAAV